MSLRSLGSWRGEAIRNNVSVTITERCVSCGACEWECPNDAISPGAIRPVVEKDRCTECYGFFGESQCIVVCPVSAIKVEVETIENLAQRFKLIHPDKAEQDTWIWRQIGY